MNHSIKIILLDFKFLNEAIVYILFFVPKVSILPVAINIYEFIKLIQGAKKYSSSGDFVLSRIEKSFIVNGN